LSSKNENVVDNYIHKAADEIYLALKFEGLSFDVSKELGVSFNEFIALMLAKYEDFKYEDYENNCLPETLSNYSMY